MGINRLKDFKKALERLKEAYTRSLDRKETDEYSFFRDSAIQRFEFTVEIFWKTLRDFLKTEEGITCKSPKGCIREFFSSGYLNEDQARKLLEMIDSRNLTSHTYHEEVAEEIFKRIENYIALLELVAGKMERRSP